jgi:hypothetical protein
MSPALSAVASPGSEALGLLRSSSPAASSTSAAGVSIPQRKSRLRRQPKKAVPTHLPKNQVIIWGTAICCLASLSILPIVLLESSFLSPESINDASHVKQTTRASVHHLMDMARKMRQHPLEFLLRKNNQQNAEQQPPPPPPVVVVEQQNQPRNNMKPQPEPPALTLNDLKSAVLGTTHGGDDTDWYQQHKDNVARGVAGRLPLDKTPAVIGSQRAHIENCPISVDSLAYWNDPVGTSDRAFVTPFFASSSLSAVKMTTEEKGQQRRKYITFAPDRGGWNNVRVYMYCTAALSRVCV